MLSFDYEWVYGFSIFSIGLILGFSDDKTRNNDESAPRPERSSFYFFFSKNKKAGVEDGERRPNNINLNT